FDYGASFAHIPPGWNIPGGGSPSGSFKLLQQRMYQTTVYPNGRANPAVNYVTTVEHVDWNGHGPVVPDFPTDQKILVPGPDNGLWKGKCQYLRWVYTNRADGAQIRDATCIEDRDHFLSFKDIGGLDGKPFLQELWKGGVKIMATYYGDTTTGVPYVLWESASYPGGVFQPGGAYVDVRPSMVVHERDGVRSTEEVVYED